MTRTISTHRLLLLAAALAMAFSMLSAAPAHADHGACVVEGEATLNGGFGGINASGSFSGTAVCASGVHDASASFTYTNTAIGGTASGNLTIGGTTCSFSWDRTGTTAVITFSGSCSGTAVAAFAPTSDPTATGPATAAVVGAGTVNH